ncbi:MAG: hypothetical protein ACKO0Z_14955, partial [Betaproteobacteria bacterium]
MSFIDQLSASQKAFINSDVVGATGPEAASLAWDLSSLDYNAPGLQGWINRGKGLIGLVSPLAWAETIQGVNINETKKNPNADFLARGLGVTGGMLGGFFQGTSTPLRVAVGSTLSLGAMADEANNFVSHHTDGKSFADKIAMSWDLSKSGEIGLGDAFNYNLSQQKAAFTNAVQNVFDPSYAADAEAASEKIGEWGLSAGDANFDIFDKKQRDVAFNWGTG